MHDEETKINGECDLVGLSGTFRFQPLVWQETQ
jgi:hypothetical protein